jgi:hypothetical protein
MRLIQRGTDVRTGREAARIAEDPRRNLDDHHQVTVSKEQLATGASPGRACSTIHRNELRTSGLRISLNVHLVAPLPA